jgi:hypothetical protein
MAIVNTATNYNGTLNEFLYKVMGLGNDITEKGAAHMITDIALMQQLDHLVATEDPFEDYTDGQPLLTGVVTKDKRDLTPKKFTISGKITPSQFAIFTDLEKISFNRNVNRITSKPAIYAGGLYVNSKFC